jgi:RNA polymerase sigma-70 factor (ECF subfamily)
MLARIADTMEPHGINGQPRPILRDRDGMVVATMALDILDGRIQSIWSVVNPTSSATSARSPTPGRSSARSSRPRPKA